MSYLDDLYNDPIVFGRKYPISINGGDVLSPADDESFIPQDSKIGFYDVAKHIRAEYFRLENNPSFAGTIRLMPSHDHDSHGGLCYWLPWSKNSIFRIELRPYGLDKNPQFFFTAALSGCSVFFEGNPDFPIVCHANAFDAPNAIKEPKTEKEHITRYLQTHAHMEGMHEATVMHEAMEDLFKPPDIRFIESREPRLPSTNVKPVDYLGVKHKAGWNTRIPISGHTIDQESGGLSHRKHTIKIGKKIGIVFGTRGPGGWRFYLQKQCTVCIYMWRYYQTADKFGWLRTVSSYLNPMDYYRWIKSTHILKQIYQIPMSCEEVWPSGAGQVMI